MVLVVEMRGVSKSFGDTMALRGLDLEMERGVFGLVGPNGAGKTTAIKILLDLVRPDEGEALILGHNCQDEPLLVRGLVGALLEKPSFLGNVRALDFLIFVGRLKGLSDVEAVDEALKTLRWVGLEPWAGKEVGDYSAGMKQRFGLAQALIGRPELVILDEFTANLDPSARMRILGDIRRISDEEGMSFLISSHILPELELVCDHIGILHQGRMVESSDVESLNRKYPSRVFKIIVSKSALFLREIKNLNFVEEAYESRGAVIVKVLDPGKLYNEVTRVVQENLMELKLFKPLHSSLEAVYEATVGEKVD